MILLAKVSRLYQGQTVNWPAFVTEADIFQAYMSTQVRINDLREKLNIFLKLVSLVGIKASHFREIMQECRFDREILASPCKRFEIRASFVIATL